MSMWRVGREASAASRGFRLATDDSLPGWKGVVDKVVKWVPGDVLALYAAGVTAFDVDNPRGWLLVGAILAGPLFLWLGAFSQGAPFGRKERVAAVLAVPATALWAGSVPGNGWLEWKVISDNPKPAAFIFVVVAAVFGLLADGIVKRTT